MWFAAAYTECRGDMGACAWLRAVAFCMVPTFENDWVRYLWDGWMFVQEGTPYDRVPLEYFADTEAQQRFGERLDDFGYPEIPTIYGPVAMVMFAAGAIIAPANMWVLKALIAGSELLGLACARKLLPERGWFIYALCPLILFEIWANMHLDALAVSCALLGLVFLQRTPVTARSPIITSVIASVCFAVALACRLHALPLVVLAAWWYRDWRLLPITGLLTLGIYLPFFLQGIGSRS